MSIQTLEQLPNNQPHQLNKRLTLIANMNTNNSLTFSQTFEQNKNGFLQTKQTIFLSKQINDLPINSRRKKQIRVNPPRPHSRHVLPPKDADTLINTMRMVMFMFKQATNQQKFIQNKVRAVNQLRKKVKCLEETIRQQKQRYLLKLSSFKDRSERLKSERKSMSKRIRTEISEIKYKIHSIKKRESTDQISSLNSKTFQNIKARRRSSRISTERSPRAKRIYIPLTCTYQTMNPHISIQQIHPYTVPIRRLNPQQNNYFQAPKQFRRTVTQHLVPNSPCRSSNPFCLIQTQSNQNQKSMRSSSKRPNSKNLFDILGEHIRIPKNANTVESLTAQKAQQPLFESLLNLSRSKSVKKQALQLDQSQRQSHNSSILDVETIKLFEDDNPNPPKQARQNISVKSSIKFKSVDFKIGNMGDSVESQYTETERPNQLLFKPKANEQSQKESNNFALSSQQEVQSGSQPSEDIIESIKLTSHSRIYKEKLAESKYIPFSENPSRLVENSQILELNLLAQSNISRKRASNSKIIKKKMQSIEIDAGKLSECQRQGKMRIFES